MHTQVSLYDSSQPHNSIYSSQMLGNTEELKHSSIENKHATKASTQRALEWVDDPQFWICYKQHNFEQIL
ncbi:hypothetical protein ACE6H2_001346 [Prunus campanulata]